ncbi:response regulator transcription factor [Brucella intermedia]|uniref:response regulator transcription factor n=1 Tax=Brucella intermedia TaxID=94625 RepID=UPI00110FCC14|nr:response regulator transcription factor [Brucella intermedia]
MDRKTSSTRWQRFIRAAFTSTTSSTNVYAFDPNGGPDNAHNTVRVQISHLRKRLPSYGWTIPMNHRGAGNHGYYCLEPVANDNVPAADRRAAA